ncbi:helix-hairpin-helix domain-containing protein [Arthrobacter sp. G119Y2]|uniref:helix-hairpin-helix domain-containing protein n=1 Tax=Arthrobacter sp. G119Y2 TaxID=3134965 RepID=UPI00311A0909
MAASSLDILPPVGAPAARSLRDAGYSSLRELADADRAELSRLHGVGPKALRLIEEALKEHGLALR